MPATFTPGDEKQEEKLNPGQHNYERQFNDEKFEERLAETPSQDDVERGLRDLENFNRDSSADVDKTIREREDEASAPKSTWDTSFSGIQNAKKKITKVQLWRRVGIFGGAGGIIGLALFFISGFIPLGGILLNLGETSTANLDVQDNFLTKRLYKVIDAKMTNNTACDVAEAACRFNRLSNPFLARLDDYGIKPYKGDTQLETVRTGFPDADHSPDNFRFTGSDGKEIKVPANEFTARLGDNVELRKAFTSALNMRYWGYADSVIKNLFYKKEGIDRSGKTTESVDSKDPQKSIKSIADGATDSNVKNITTEDAAKNAATQEIEDLATKEAASAAKRIAKTGDPALMAATAACVAVNVPGIFSSAVRLYQMRQEIVLASTLVLTATSMLKAGDMKPETMATIGTLLTATAILANGSRTKSAMDSAGMKSVLFGDNVSTSDSKFAKFIPGKKAIDSTKGISAFANSDAVKDTCKAINSPEAQVVVSAAEGAISATGVGGVIVGLLKAGSWAAVKVVGAQGIIDLATPLIKQGIGAIIAAIPAATIMDIFGNQDISNASGEDLGNVLGGGLSFFFSNAALSTGIPPMTTSQVTAYEKESQDTMVAYAEQDRAGRSPLDVSSPYTFLGSMLSNYYKYAYVPNNILQTAISSFGYTLSQPFKLFNSNTYAAANTSAALYSHASDFGVDSSVAVGPYGQLAPGMDPQFSNESNQAVVSSVSDQVDPQSGQPNSDSDIATMLSDCSDGSLLNAAGCTVKDQQRANQSLYLTDLRINDILDGTNTDKDTDTSTPATSTSRPTGAIDFKNGWTFANNTDYSSYPCDPRTTDAGVYKNPDYGFTVRLCAVSFNTPPASPGASNLIASVISTNAMNMFEAARNDGVELGISDGMRKASDPDYSSYTQHKYGLAMDLGTPRGGSTICYAGVPSTSSGWGSLSAAQAACQRIGGIQYAAYQWLNQHAATYGFHNLDVEPWHWSTSGG